MNDNFVFGISEFPAFAHRLYLFSSSIKSQDSSVGIVNSYKLDGLGAIADKEKRFLHCYPDRLWSPRWVPGAVSPG
jgi:hypothetical protein